MRTPLIVALLNLTIATAAIAQISDWAVLADTSDGGQLQISPSSYRRRHISGRNPEIVFNGRYVDPDGKSYGSTRYIADCSRGTLLSASTGSSNTSTYVTVEEGTVGGVLWSWACYQ